MEYEEQLDRALENVPELGGATSVSASPTRKYRKTGRSPDSPT
ncbi:hypothetical protein SY89_00717 [Halolamina pelagica]|uniref:Uncharacterized protein n=1 Tax=Halolamina pelagica TaxID=699431 RepID=A0A0P7I016_9EURY|nr:hypothetical protein SY89_00717 [Halolamina pelagica]